MGIDSSLFGRLSVLSVSVQTNTSMLAPNVEYEKVATTAHSDTWPT